MRETSVVGFEKGTNILPGLLVRLVDGDASFDDIQGVEHEGDAVQEILPSRLLDHIAIELLLVLSRDDIPGLGASLVVVVDGVEPEILHVPAEGGESHAHVHPGHSHPADVLLLLIGDPQDRIAGLVHIVQVVQARVVVEILVRGLAVGVERESAAQFVHGQISCILHRCLVLPVGAFCKQQNSGLPLVLFISDQYSDYNFYQSFLPLGHVRYLYPFQYYSAMAWKLRTLQAYQFSLKAQVMKIGKTDEIPSVKIHTLPNLSLWRCWTRVFIPIQPQLKQKGGFHSGGVINLTAPQFSYSFSSCTISSIGSFFIYSKLNFFSGIILIFQYSNFQESTSIGLFFLPIFLGTPRKPTQSSSIIFFSWLCLALGIFSLLLGSSNMRFLLIIFDKCFQPPVLISTPNKITLFRPFPGRPRHCPPLLPNKNISLPNNKNPCQLLYRKFNTINPTHRQKCGKKAKKQVEIRKYIGLAGVANAGKIQNTNLFIILFPLLRPMELLVLINHWMLSISQKQVYQKYGLQ